ncbi:MAG TPA: hypothetical protein VEY90_01210, partial [Thermoleophilaceae bacterium]|nr:hypothetical protein [Thermoleophilaceae bacterium]
MVARQGAKASLAAVLVAAAAVVGLLALAAPARADVSPFREVGVLQGDVRVRGDGVRFVWIQSTTGPPWVFDTLAGRSFQPPPPFPDCHPVHVAGGVVLWRCLSAGVPLVTYLATGATREPAGWAAVEATETPYSNCDADRIGRHWLQYTCRALMGGDPSPEYLNHRTGAGGALPDGTYLGSPLIDFDYAGLVRPPCAPLDPTRL